MADPETWADAGRAVTSVVDDWSTSNMTAAEAMSLIIAVLAERKLLFHSVKPDFENIIPLRRH
jgi:hypothetical protein